MRRSGEAARAMQKACEVCEACAEVFVRAVHTPRVYYAHAWEGQPEVLVHARCVECQEVPGRSECQESARGERGPHSQHRRRGEHCARVRRPARSLVTCCAHLAPTATATNGG